MPKAMTSEQVALQRQIIADLAVAPTFDAAHEAERRVRFLADYLHGSGLRTMVLGISGGVDSLAAGLLAQRAAVWLRENRNYGARFVAMRLPYGRQHDEDDARACVDVIGPDQLIVTDVQQASDAMLDDLRRGGLSFDSPARQDFVLGNIKARQRMIAQFAVAGAASGLVIGTDHAAEALVGFFTKFGDGAADVMPLAGLNKRRVRALAAHLGAPDALVFKVPTADLESLAPLRPDEEAFGVSYDDIDDFLEGKPISASACDIILRHWRSSAHKRALPVVPPMLS